MALKFNGEPFMRIQKVDNADSKNKKETGKVKSDEIS
jgi:hypothetical protein